jgi:hypothetical protein
VHIVGPIPAVVAGLLDREDKNERISWDVFGYHLDNYVGDLIRHPWIFHGDLVWSSLGYQRMY